RSVARRRSRRADPRGSGPWRAPGRDPAAGGRRARRATPVADPLPAAALTAAPARPPTPWSRSGAPLPEPAPPDLVPAQPDHDHQGLDDDLPRHLGSADAPIAEGDRHLDHAGSGAAGAMGHLDLEH